MKEGDRNEPKRPVVVFLNEVGSDDLHLVGGKGANLGELIRLGVPVPPGFCVTTAAFWRFVGSVVTMEDIYDTLSRLNEEHLDEIRSVSERARSVLLDSPISEDVASEILRAWQETGEDYAYAVRSSATAEDLPDASFAGQQESFLNVRGETALLEAVRKCWASLFTDRAILYRIRNRFDHRKVGLSVVVQRMVFATKSGILFTADPVTGHRHTVTINASFGLGEALVGGIVNPDVYHVDKRTRAVTHLEISDKERATVPSPDGGVRQVSLPPQKRTVRVLNDEEIASLVDLGIRIEDHFGAPQDIEWAIAVERPADAGAGDDAKPYILQARPITSLYPLDGLKSPDDTLHVYFSMGHQQNMTRPLSPLSRSTVLQLVPIGRSPDGSTNPYVRSSGGRLFADITYPLRHPILRRAVVGLVARFDALAPQGLNQVMARPEFRGPYRFFPKRDLIVPGLRFGGRILRALWLRDLTGFIDQTNARIEEYVAEFEERVFAQCDDKERLQTCKEQLHGLFAFFLNWIPETIAGDGSRQVLIGMARRWLSPSEQSDLTVAVPGNVVNEMNLAIGDLADLVREIPAIAARLNDPSTDPKNWLHGLPRNERTESFLREWESFLSRFGARGPAEIELMVPRFVEDPTPVLRVIANHLRGSPRIHRDRLEALDRARETAWEKFTGYARKGFLGPLRLRLIRRLRHVMLEAGGLREHHKYVAIRVLWVVKRVLMELAARQVEAGRLDSPSDIWFLTWKEIEDLLEPGTTDPLRAEIAKRRADLERFQRLQPPLIITSDGESPVVRYDAKNVPAGALVGHSVSPGVVEGIVRVVHDPTLESLAPGEVLVAQYTDPGWTPLFLNAAGLVLEVGGDLTHGAVVAREYGIPCVVGVRNATQKLRTGDRVRVDGNRGFVIVLDVGSGSAVTSSETPAGR
ncbi:MAG: phosphoenolpyruvate synthase [Armatimonadetes bacterium]|nr:MAG: phosphoenolpyruvate synthase [Armatimonadota bacterium]